MLAGLLPLGAGASSAADALLASAQSGPVEVTLRLQPKEPVIGDPLTLEIEVRAEPEVEVLMPEFGEALDRFAIVDFAPRERVDETGATVAQQRYTLQASRSGRQHIPPILVEFVDRRPGRDAAPEGEDAWELLTERLEFDVASVLPEDAPLELLPARGPLGPLEAPGPPLWPVVAIALACTLAASPFAARWWLAYRARMRQRSSFEIATAELEQLLSGTRPDGAQELDAFFVALSGIVRRYLENRFGLRSPELTTEEFLSAMAGAAELSGEHRSLLRGFLQRADLVKFAHFVPDTRAVEDSIRVAHRFLTETREPRTLSEPARAEAVGA